MARLQGRRIPKALKEIHSVMIFSEDEQIRRSMIEWAAKPIHWPPKKRQRKNREDSPEAQERRALVRLAVGQYLVTAGEREFTFDDLYMFCHRRGFTYDHWNATWAVAELMKRGVLNLTLDAELYDV
jgi:hypothetical protein